MGPEVTNEFACKLLKTELGFASSALADDFRTFSVSGAGGASQTAFVKADGLDLRSPRQL
jgi:hypothetical protein